LKPEPNAALFAARSGCYMRDLLESRISSAVEQRFCKPKVGSSILSSGTIVSDKSSADFTLMNAAFDPAASKFAFIHRKTADD
jgi:hypothetical protein